MLEYSISVHKFVPYVCGNSSVDTKYIFYKKLSQTRVD